MDFRAGVFDRLVSLGRLLLDGSRQVPRAAVEVALELDAEQLQRLHAQIQDRSWGGARETAEQLLACCEIGWEACQLLFDGVVEDALDILYEARDLYLEILDDLAGQRSACAYYG